MHWLPLKPEPTPLNSKLYTGVQLDLLKYFQNTDTHTHFTCEHGSEMILTDSENHSLDAELTQDPSGQ